MDNDVDWTAGKIEQLKALWAKGISTVEIGNMMGCSKNAVVGKVHRLKLEPRASPIRRVQPGALTTRPARQPIPKLSELMKPSVSPPAITPATPQTAKPKVAKMIRPLQKPITPDPTPINTAMPRPTISKHPCCWPIGDPAKPGFRYCDRPALQGHPYCEDHCATAYVRSRAPTTNVRELARLK